MKKNIVSIGIVTIFGLVVMSGLAMAAARYNVTSTLGGTSGDYFDLDGIFSVQSIKVGEQGVGGVTFFNGTIVNQTVTDSGGDIPVTFGDNVRIDGTIFRGETEGPGDDLPIKFNDDAKFYGTAQVDGTLDVTGATTLADTLEVSGTATFGSSLTVTGATTLTGALTVNGGITLGAGNILTIGEGETLDITGATITGLSSDDVSDVASLAMLDEAETITGNWDNTVNPWSAAEVANIERQIELPLESFLNVTTFNEITETSAATEPVIALNNSVPSVVWADADTDWIAQTFVVPADYASGGHFEVVAAENAGVTTDVGVDFDVYINKDNVDWDAAATDQTRVDVGASTAPQILTLTPATDFANLTADDTVTLRLTRADGGAGAEDLELYEVRFAYIAAQ